MFEWSRSKPRAETKLRPTIKPDVLDFPAVFVCLCPCCLFFLAVSASTSIAPFRSLCLSVSLSLSRLIFFSAVRSVVYPKALFSMISYNGTKLHEQQYLWYSCWAKSPSVHTYQRWQTFAATPATGGAFHERQSSRWASTVLQ